jgi:hypothetical protein
MKIAVFMAASPKEVFYVFYCPPASYIQFIPPSGHRQTTPLKGIAEEIAASQAWRTPQKKGPAFCGSFYRL